MCALALKPPAKAVIKSLDVSDETVTNWTTHLRNACTRTSCLIVIKIGMIGKWVQADETHWFKVPNHHRGECRKHRN